MVEPETKAVDGRTPGKRGQQTRQRLLDATLALLSDTNFRELKVVDIAKQAGTSPATFYQYFTGVEEPILAAAEEMTASGTADLVGLVGDERWVGAEGLEIAERIAAAFIQFWEDNRPLMRAIDLTAEEGDTRFREIRTRLLNEFTQRLASVIELEKQAGCQPNDVDTMATAGVMVSMLSHVASHRYGFESYGIGKAAVVKSMGRVVFSGVTGGSK